MAITVWKQKQNMGPGLDLEIGVVWRDRKSQRNSQGCA